MPGGKIRVYFLGSGVFAVPYLKVLCESPSVELAGAGTQPDRPAGRKHQLKPTPLGSFADSHGIPCSRIESVNTDSFRDILYETKPDLIVVVSFGQLLREFVLGYPPLGCLNVHASILPKYRGASPIAAMILNGETAAGVTFMKMDKGLDTGGIYDVFTMPLGSEHTTASLEVALSEASASRIIPVIEKIAGGLKPVPQDEVKATITRKIKKSDGSIDWSEPADMILRKLRGYFPWPGSFFLMPGFPTSTFVKITLAKLAEGSGTPGTVLSAGKTWIVACGSGAIEILRVIPEGSREMAAADYLRGRLKAGIPARLLNGQRAQQ